MTTAADGTPFTGTVTCYVTLDAGTQAIGTVGSGVCTHEGGGYHTYAPSQAETNGNLCAYQFRGTGAITTSVQVFTTAWAKSLANVPANVAQFGGSSGTFASGRPEVNVSHFGGTAGTFASGRPNVNTSHVGGTSQTGRDIGASVLLSSGTGTGQISLSSGAVLLQATQTGVTIPTVTTLTNAPSDSSGVTTLLSRLSSARAGYLDNLSAGAAALESSVQSVITTLSGMAAAAASAVWSAGTRLLTAGTNIVLAKGTGVTGFTDLDASGVRTAVGLASANLDTQLGTIDNVVDAIKVSTDNLPSDPADQSLVIAATDGIMTRLGSPAGASVSADVAAIKSDTGAILTDTGTTLDGKIDAIKSVTDVLPDAGALTSLSADASDAKTAAESAEATLTALTEDSSGIRFTEKALEEAPTGGGGGGGDATEAKQDQIIGLIGTPATDVSADIAAIKAQTAAIEADTQDLQTQIGTDGAGLTAIGDTRLVNLDATMSSRLASSSYTAPPSAATNAGAVRTELATELGRIDASVSTRATASAVSALPSASDIATAVLNAAASSPIKADLDKINGTDLTGNGSSGAPWGPA